jgi:hypothetical protein
VPKYDPLYCSAMYALASAKHLGSMSSGDIVIHTTRNGIKNQCAIRAIPTIKLT